MRRLIPLFLAPALMLGATACGSGTVVSPTAKEVVGTVPQESKGDPAEGKRLYTSLGCAGCHSLDGTPGAGPTFKGVAGSERTLEGGQTVTADDKYLLESITDPDKQILDGFQRGVMSAVIKPGQVSQSDARSLVAYIKTVK